MPHFSEWDSPADYFMSLTFLAQRSLFEFTYLDSQEMLNTLEALVEEEDQ